MQNRATFDKIEHVCRSKIVIGIRDAVAAGNLFEFDVNVSTGDGRDPWRSISSVRVARQLFERRPFGMLYHE